MIIEWLWVRGRESSLFSAPRFRLWGTAPGRSPRIRDAYTVGKKLARCQRCRARIPTYPYISLHISTIWPEYDQNMTRIWPVLTIWLYDTLCYYQLFSTIAQIDLLTSQAISKRVQWRNLRFAVVAMQNLAWFFDITKFHGLLNTTCYFMHFHAISTYWLGSSIPNLFASDHGELRWILWKWTLQPQPPALWIG